MSVLSSLTNRIFLASALLLVVSIGIAVYRVTDSVSRRAEVELRTGLAEAASFVKEYSRAQFADFVTKAKLITDLPVLKNSTATDDPPTVQLNADGRLVLGEPVEARLSVERDKSTPNEGETLTDVLLDTPVVVRVELGAVSMSAREWARLGTGDVIETGQRIAEPVVLRIAGREVGRGELVNVDGQVGVRIQKLYEGS